MSGYRQKAKMGSVRCSGYGQKTKIIEVALIILLFHVAFCCRQASPCLGRVRERMDGGWRVGGGMVVGAWLDG